MSILKVERILNDFLSRVKYVHNLDISGSIVRQQLLILLIITVSII